MKTKSLKFFYVSWRNYFYPVLRKLLRYDIQTNT
jgi:hypothetical protein